MAQLKHPLLGDALYGGAMGLGMDRQALHACRLAFAHPVTGQPLSFSAPLPADF
jgi:23S rRNA pseudouridine1911/1915/1917 synthase